MDADRNEFANAAQELEKAALARDALLSAAADDQQIWTGSDPGETARFRLTQTPAAAFHMPSDPAIALAGPIVARWVRLNGRLSNAGPRRESCGASVFLFLARTR